MAVKSRSWDFEAFLGQYPLLLVGLVVGPIGRSAACWVGGQLHYYGPGAFRASSLFAFGYFLSLILVPFSKESRFKSAQFIALSTLGGFLTILSANLYTLEFGTNPTNLYPHRFWLDPALISLQLAVTASAYCLLRFFYKANRANREP